MLAFAPAPLTIHILQHCQFFFRRSRNLVVNFKQMAEPNHFNQPQQLDQQEQHVPRPAQIFLPAVCKDLVETWVETRLKEAKYLAILISHKRMILTKLVDHAANGTFPTDIHCSDPFRQYPQSIDPARIRLANEEELQLAITFKKGMLKIRSQLLTQDLKVQEDKLKLLLHPPHVMQLATEELTTIPKTPEVLQEVANTFICEYERQQYIYKNSIQVKKQAAATAANINHPMDIAHDAIDGNQFAIFQRTQEAMMKKIEALETRLKQRKNSSGRGSGNTPQKGKQSHSEARERSASRGRSKQRSSLNQKNRAKSSNSNKSEDTKTTSNTAAGKGGKGKGSPGKGGSKEQQAKGKSKR